MKKNRRSQNDVVTVFCAAVVRNKLLKTENRRKRVFLNDNDDERQWTEMDEAVTCDGRATSALGASSAEIVLSDVEDGCPRGRNLSTDDVAHAKNCGDVGGLLLIGRQRSTDTGYLTRYRQRCVRLNRERKCAEKYNK